MKITLSKDQAILLRLLLTEERERREMNALKASVGKRLGITAVNEEIDRILKQLPVLG